ncbi:MAG: hypothetical protein H7A54_14895 [Akkermansiaceae bacterium]|nr:hypothetical protein [Akkermansiaceae bacterium]
MEDVADQEPSAGTVDQLLVTVLPVWRSRDIQVIILLREAIAGDDAVAAEAKLAPFDTSGALRRRTSPWRDWIAVR